MVMDILSINLNADLRFSSILNLKNQERIMCLYSIDKGSSIIKSMKGAGIYKAIGARENKRVYVASHILTLAYSECHPFCFSEFICSFNF